MKVSVYLLALLLLSVPALADIATEPLIFPKPISQPPARYPKSMLESGQQGWVKVNFVVSERGTVVEPLIEASSGERAFERAALEAVEAWRYEPARRDGVPVPQRSVIRLSFQLDGEASTDVSRAFFRRYRKIERALARDDLESALDYLQQASEAKRLSVGELAWLAAMRAQITEMQGNDQQTLLALRKALADSEGWIPKELEAGLLRVSFALELNNGNYAVALEVYDRLQDMDDYDTSALAPFVDQLTAFIDSDKIIATPAAIGAGVPCETCTTRWQQKLLRRSVELTDVDGELETIEFRCDWARHVSTAREGVSWDVPENWGECSVVVSGETGATFKLVELPDA